MLVKFQSLLGRGSSFKYFLTSAPYPEYLLRGNAAEICREHAHLFCSGRGVDVGASRWPFSDARKIEDTPDENALRIKEASESLDYVFSSHCLEHIAAWKQALQEWIRVLKPGGVLYLYLPHPACEMWKPGNNPFHEWTPTPAVVAGELKSREMEIVEISYFPDVYFSFYVIARKS